LEQTDLASDASQGLAHEVENLIDKVEDLIEDFLGTLGETGSSETGETGRNRLGIVGDDDDDEPDDEEPPEEGTNSTTAVTTG